MAQDPEIKNMVPFMRSRRNFDEYTKFLYKRGIDLGGMILNKALNQEEVNFYDLGCGYGVASTDFFEVLEKQTKRMKLPLSILDEVKYIGVDNYITNPIKSTDERITFNSPIDLREMKDSNLPPIDIGVAFFVFPYLDRKIESLAEIYNLLRTPNEEYQAGEIVVTDFNPDQIKKVPLEATAWQMEKYYSNFPNLSLDKIIEGDPNILKFHDNNFRLHKGDAQVAYPSFIASKQEDTYWCRNGPKGPRAGQKISLYRFKAA